MVALAKKDTSLENFIKVNVQAAEDGHSIAWIAAQLGMSEAYVGQKRVALRNRGLPLPELRRGNQTEQIDVDRCTSLIETLLKGNKNKRRSAVHAAMGA